MCNIRIEDWQTVGSWKIYKTRKKSAKVNEVYNNSDHVTTMLLQRCVIESNASRNTQR